MCAGCLYLRAAWYYCIRRGELEVRTNLRIGEILEDKGYVTAEQIGQALAYQKEHRDKRVGQILMELGFVTENQVLEALADRLHLEIVLSEEAPLKKAVSYYYAEVHARKAAKQANVGFSTTDIDELEIENLDNPDEAPIIQLLNSLIERAIKAEASDIHIEPFEDKLHVRMRIDGMLVDYLDLNKNIQAALIVRIKILSNMDIAEKRLPQDGHFMGVIDGVELNIRVSVIPTIFGEKIVMRYLNSNSTIDRLSTFGMTEENFKKMNHMMSMPHGIIYVTGPTGSGKTTTLYMILEKLAQGQINISTIEDPVERKLNRINQMQVNTMSGLTFDRGLRALMRQDPDVIMVGETRDKETAEISVRAAITGHLVVSTLHTNDAISTIVRLEEMGVEPYMVANSLVGVVAQRLMRKVCPYCKKEVATSLSDRLALQEGIKYISKGTGCPHCNQTGYKGRIAIHEVIEIEYVK